MLKNVIKGQGANGEAAAEQDSQAPRTPFTTVPPPVTRPPTLVPPSKVVLTLEATGSKLTASGGCIIENQEIEHRTSDGKFFVRLEVQMPDEEET